MPYYEPPIARGTVEPPLRGKGYLPVGYGDSGSVPHEYYLRDGQNVDVGILKLFLSMKQVNLSHVAQPSPFQVAPIQVGGPSQSRSPSSVVRVPNGGIAPSPFVPIGGCSTTQSSPFQVVSSRGTLRTVVPDASDFELTSLPSESPWSTVEIPVVQRRRSISTTTPSSPFQVISSRGTVQTVVPEDLESTLLWDTVEIPVVQRHAI